MARLRFGIAFLIFLFTSVEVFAANFTYHGQIIKPTGHTVQSSSVTFNVQILSPGAEECVLYRETHVINMSNSNGIFSLLIGSGNRAPSVGFEYVNSLSDALSNGTGMVTPDNCAAIGTYNPSSGDSRKIRITITEDSNIFTLPDQMITTVPYAASALSIDGLSASQILSDDGADLNQANLETVFSVTNYPILLDLIGGTSNLYLSSTPTAPVNMNGQVINAVADPLIGTDAANRNYVDSTVGGRPADTVALSGLTVGDAGNVLVWNGTEWTSGAPSADATKLPLAGGTMTGTLNMGNQDITNANTISANTNISATQNISAGNDLTAGNNLSVTNNVTVTGGIGVGTGINSGGAINLENQNELRFSDLTNTNYVALRAPAVVSAPVVLTLPDGDGANGEVLSTNGLGQLAWVQNNSITSVFGRTGVVVADNGDYTASQVTNAAAGDIAAVTVQAAINELDSEKVNRSGDNLTGALTFDTENELRFSDNDNSHYVGFKSPANILAAASFVWELPSDDGSAGQVLQTDGNGVLSFVSIPSAPVTTVFGRAGNVVSANGDYTASQVTNVAAGNIAAVTVQAAINELDSEKLSAVGGSSLTDGNIWVGDGSNQAQPVVMSGDATLDNTGALSISAGAVNNSKLAADAVDSGKIVNDSIMNADINSAANIARTKLANGTANRLLVNDGSGVMSDAAAITANRALTSDANGIPVASSVTNTEMGYLSGVTSSIQTQLDGKQASLGYTPVNQVGDTMTGQLLIDGGNDEVQLAIEGDLLQTTNLVEIRDSTSAVLASISSDGSITAATNLTTKSYVDTEIASAVGSLSSDEIRDADDNTKIQVEEGANDNTIRFDTAGSERMIIGPTGLVKIGSGTPATMLDIDGTLKIADGSEACSIAADGGMMRYSGGNLQFCNGTSWQTLGISGAGLTSLGGQSGSTQTFAAGSAGNSPAISSAGDTHTLNVPLASAGGTVTSGTISNADYVNFSNKLDAIAGETLASGNVWVGDGSNQAQAVALSGDASLSNTGALTIAASAVTNGKIADGAVDNPKLAADAVDSSKILNDSIMNSDINSAADIARTKLADGAANRILVNDGSGVMTDAAAITANRALLSDANGIPVASSVTNTELGYVSGVTSSIQTQLDGKQASIGYTPVNKAGDDMTGQLTMSPVGANSGDGGQIVYRELAVNGVNSVGFRAPDDITSSVLWTLPAADGSVGQILSTSGAGVLSWITPPQWCR